MASNFLNIYAVLHLFFFSLAAYIMHKFSLDIATQLEYRAFRSLIKNYLIYVVISVTCTFAIYTDTLMPEWTANLLWHGNVLCQVCIALSLYSFAIFRNARRAFRRRWFAVLSTLPFAGIVICLLVSLFNGFVLRVTPDKQLIYGPGFILVVVLVLTYFAAIFVYAVAKFNLAKSYIKRRQLFALAASTIFVLVSITVDTFYREDCMSILPAATMTAIVYLYINMQDASIYTDILTGMNNRRKAYEYLGSCLRSVSKDSPVYIYMCDVNSFKEINDGYGHDEGDRALVLAASALKEAASRHDAFAARLGGDEFLFAWFPWADPQSEEEPERLVGEISRLLEGKCKKAEKPYQVTFSIGYTRCTDPESTLADCVREADRMLYERKRVFHGKAGGN
ncbi:MAG: GGDEF domain-containing protein [Oscillospiraceae bacterium]|nr:GGDEF domain-containing protein [Oscillospiraceae bacterium]